ncbi:glycosyltransferase family 2 protein [Candidatus Roizmanbacteria bacterium]|nr:glycosyltransferase family 2 protein [Candidatus Roizmanbacteria bacterium]
MNINIHPFHISICVPVYNRPALTLKSLKSISNQTIKPFEIIVLDDHSTEDMSEVEKYCKINKFTYIRNSKNLGLIKNINETISYTKGNYWCILHNDDILSPYYVEECQKFLHQYPNYDIWATNGCAIDSEDKIIGEFRLFNKDFTIKKRVGFKLLYKNGYNVFLSIIGSTIYKTLFIKNHLFDTTWGNEADLDNALYFLSKYYIKYVDTPIYFTRLHDRQESKMNKITLNKVIKYINNRIFIYKKYSTRFTINNFLIPIYSIHLLQLIIKYKISLKEALTILKISKQKKDVLFSIYYILIFILYSLKYKIFFLFHKKVISRYLSSDYFNLK